MRRSRAALQGSLRGGSSKGHVRSLTVAWREEARKELGKEARRSGRVGLLEESPRRAGGRGGALPSLRRRVQQQSY